MNRKPPKIFGFESWMDWSDVHYEWRRHRKRLWCKLTLRHCPVSTVAVAMEQHRIMGMQCRRCKSWGF